MLRERVDRRRALSTGAKVALGTVVGLAVGGTGGYFARAPGAAQTTTLTVAQTSTVTQTVTATVTASPTTTPGLTPLEGPDHALVMAIGGYRPDLVKENVEEFDRQFNAKGPRTELQQLSGDLIAAYTTKLIAGAPLDIIYSYPYSTVTWANAGYILPIDDIKKSDIVPYNMSDIKSQLYPNWVEAFTVNGKLYGLPYYTSDVGMLLTNEKLLAEAGMTGDYPKTWKEFYEQAEKLKPKAPTGEPVLHHWYNEPFGIPWGWLLETINQGGDKEMFDTKPPYAPMFDVGTLAEEVLKDWKDAWDKGLVPKGVLTMKQTDYLGAFATGKYFYHPNGDYFAGFMNDPSKSQIAGFCSFVPYKKQPWGLIDTAADVLVKRAGRTDKDREYAAALLEFMGYKDRYGRFLVPKKWAMLESLQSGFPEVVNDPEVKEAFKKRLMRIEDLQVIRKHLETAAVPSGWKAPWYAKWNTKAQSELPQIFTGQKTIKEVVTILRKYGDDLVKEQG